MSVRFWTSKAKGLLHAFTQAVQIGDVTWEQDERGLFTHKSQHLKNKAFMQAKLYQDSLAFAVLRNEEIEVTPQLYGMFQACLMQTFLTHFADQFTLVDASAQFRSRDGELDFRLTPIHAMPAARSAYFKPFVPEQRASQSAF